MFVLRSTVFELSTILMIRGWTSLVHPQIIKIVNNSETVGRRKNLWNTSENQKRNYWKTGNIIGTVGESTGKAHEKHRKRFPICREWISDWTLLRNYLLNEYENLSSMGTGSAVNCESLSNIRKKFWQTHIWMSIYVEMFMCTYM